MKKVSYILALLILAGSAVLQGQSEYNSREELGITFEWKIVGGDRLQIRLSAPTEGWVAVGFNPSKMMKDADFKMAYVDGTEVVVQDHFGTGNISHKKDTDIGGTYDIEVISGMETNGSTTVEFIIPLNSGDSKDSVLRAGDEVKVLLAYARRDDLTRKHSRRTSIYIDL